MPVGPSNTEDQWTPSTEQVRSHYVFNQSDQWDAERGAAFDRWLAEARAADAEEIAAANKAMDWGQAKIDRLEAANAQLTQQVAAVRAWRRDFTLPTTRAWSDLDAILDPSPVTPEPQTITVTPEVLAKLQEGPPAGSIPYAGYGPQYWVNLDEIHPPVTPESEGTNS